MRRFLALIFLFIFSFQVIPVKGIARMLHKCQATEDVQQDDASADDAIVKAADYNDVLFDHSYSFEYTAAAPVVAEAQSVPVCYRVVYPPAHITEILSPPPNC